MTLYQKVIAVFGAIYDSLKGKADNTELASLFDSEKTYEVGECTLYNNVLFKCTATHSGEWDADHFTRTTVASAIPYATRQLVNDAHFVTVQDIESKFDSMELPDDANQQEMRTMIQNILSALKNMTACLAAIMCLCSYAGENRLDGNTTWDKVYPTNTVQSVIHKFSPAPDFSASNPVLANTIRSLAPVPDLSPANPILSSTILSLASPAGFGVNNDGEFWISYSKTSSMDKAPIYYSKGTLYLNANQVVTKGGVIGGGGGDTNQYDFACFVSSENGSDFNDGKTAATPFQTLDKAITVATNGVVCVMSGTYEYPVFYGKSDILDYGVDFIAVAGPNQTFIAETSPMNPGIIHSLGYMSFFKGFTFKNLTHSKGYNYTTHGMYRAAVEYTAFENCRFVDIDTELLGEWQYPMFFYCIMDDCSLDATIRYPSGGNHTDNGNAAGSLNYDRIFFSCAFLDCDLTIRTGGSYPSFGDSNYMRNCVVRSGTLYRAGRFHGGVNSWGPPIETSRLDDTTFIVEHSIASDRVQFVGSGSIVGIGSGVVPDAATVSLTYGVYTNAITVSGALGADFRIRVPAKWFFMGYDSKEDRTLLEMHKAMIREDLGL